MIRRCKQSLPGPHSISFHNFTTIGLTRFYTSTIIEVIARRYRFRRKGKRGSMTPRHFNVLFLCVGNSARSIMAEAIMNRKGFPNFTGYSAGSHPTGHVSPHALKQVASGGMPVEGLRSKSWDEFGTPDAPEIHFVFTVCDREVGEPCPVWHGQPLTAQWSVPDPALVSGTDDKIDRAYFDAYRMLDRRITLFVSLPLATLEQEVVQREIDKIGRS
jgi:arsenate reductase (thioredoxin)